MKRKVKELPSVQSSNEVLIEKQVSNKYRTTILVDKLIKDESEPIFLSVSESPIEASNVYKAFLISESTPDSIIDIESWMSEKNSEILKEIITTKEQLRNIYKSQLNVITGNFEQCPNLFKIIRHDFAKYLLCAFTPVENEIESVELRYEIEKVIAKIDLLKIEFIDIISTLVKAGHQYCREFMNKYKSGEILVKFAEFWSNYIKTIIKLDYCFRIISDTINEATEIILKINPAPKFAIHRVMVEVFVNYCYQPIKSRLFEDFKTQLNHLTKHIVYDKAVKNMSYKLRQELIKKLNKQYDFTISAVVDSICIMSDCVQSILDMYMHVVNVNYIDTIIFLDRIDNPNFLLQIKEQLNTTFMKMVEEIDENESMRMLKEMLIKELVSLYERLFPPAFLEEIRKYMQKMNKEIWKEIVRKEYDEMSKDKLKDINKVNLNQMEYIKDTPENLINSIKSVLEQNKESINIDKIYTILDYLWNKKREIFYTISSTEKNETYFYLSQKTIIRRNEADLIFLNKDIDRQYTLIKNYAWNAEQIIDNIATV